MKWVPSTVPTVPSAASAAFKAAPPLIARDESRTLVASDVDHFERLLRHHGIDVSQWQTGKAKSVAALWLEVQRGEAVLRIDPSGVLCRCLSVVKVRLSKPAISRQTCLHPVSSRARVCAGWVAPAK